MDGRGPLEGSQFHHITEDQLSELGFHALAALQIASAGGKDTSEFAQEIAGKREYFDGIAKDHKQAHLDHGELSARLNELKEFEIGTSPVDKNAFLPSGKSREMYEDATQILTKEIAEARQRVLDTNQLLPEFLQREHDL
jgi:hypothetical protein